VVKDTLHQARGQGDAGRADFLRLGIVGPSAIALVGGDRGAGGQGVAEFSRATRS